MSRAEQEVRDLERPTMNGAGTRPWSALRQHAAALTAARPGSAGLPTSFSALQGFLLVACIALTGAPLSVAPGTGLDPSWRSALSLSHLHGLHYGSDLVFTYGPLGYLDFPLALSRFDLAKGLAFSVLATAVAWFALRRAFARRLSADWAAVVATAILAIVTPAGAASSVLLLGVALMLIDYLGSSEGGRAWVPAFSAVCAALLLEVKFSEGVFVALAVAAACVFGPSPRVRRSVQSAIAYLIAFVVTWLAAGQSLGDVPQWVRNSLDLSRGYADAMSYELGPSFLTYALIFVTAGAVFAYGAAVHKTQGRRAAIGLVVVTGLIAYLAFREATSRRDPGHEYYFYFWSIPALAWFATSVRAKTSRYVLLVVAVTIAANAGLFATSIGPVAQIESARQRWASAIEAVVKHSYQKKILKQAREDAQQVYQLPPAMKTYIAGRPLAVDGSEVNLAWAYRAVWEPAPIFQSYAAYTASLDERNARWLVSSPPGQLFMRPPSTAIDGRNTLWDSPRYVVTEMCHTRRLVSTSAWMLLHKSADRCGASSTVSTVQVRAGQVVDVPSVGPSQILTMSFDADRVGVLTRLARSLNKSFGQLKASVDGHEYRLPRSLAVGPLVLTVPDEVGWPAVFGGGTSAHTVSFTEPGRITFSVMDVSE